MNNSIKITLGTIGYLSRKDNSTNAIELTGRIVKNNKTGWSIQNLNDNKVKSYNSNVWNFTIK
jgi:hypothetical protein